MCSQAGHQRLGMVLAGHGERALGDVLGEIADALQVAGDLERGHDVAQVVGHRLAAGDHQDGLLLELALQAVDGAVAGDARFGELGIAPLQRVEGLRRAAARPGRPSGRPCWSSSCSSSSYDLTMCSFMRRLPLVVRSRQPKRPVM